MLITATANVGCPVHPYLSKDAAVAAGFIFDVLVSIIDLVLKDVLLIV